ncbi:MAG TPA: homoserine dehydrogenase [Phototrophicaceae bacterium]|nr:homoserine dehydrogenase [Phototrophicaceae bacterium]
MDIILIGFGGVGKGLAQILRDKESELWLDQAFRARIVGVATRSHGTLYHPDGLDLDNLLDGTYFDHPEIPFPGLARDWDALRLVRESKADVIVEVSPTNLQTGQPALDLCRAAFESGKHVVLANKGPVAVAYDELQSLAQAKGKLLRFEATVMAGTPSIRLGMQALAGCTIERVRGIFNGTTNYMLTQMEGGLSYAEALAEAQALGYAEADPTADVDGWDAAGKGIILAAAIFGQKLTLNQMDVSGIREITQAEIAAAQAANERIKLIVEVTAVGGKVSPTRLPISHPLASVSGSTNAITYVTDLLGDVTLIGKGAGGVQTGFGLLSDLIEVAQCLR